MSLVDLLNNPSGSFIASIILGLGLAAVFRSVCNEKGCMVIKGPKFEDTDKYYYKIHDKCYKYTPVVSECIGHTH